MRVNLISPKSQVPSPKSQVPSPKSQVPSLRSQGPNFKSQVPSPNCTGSLGSTPLCYLDLRERSLRFLVPSSNFQVPNSVNERARGNLENHGSLSFFRSFFHQKINIKRKRSAYFSQSLIVIAFFCRLFGSVFSDFKSMRIK